MAQPSLLNIANAPPGQWSGCRCPSIEDYGRRATPAVTASMPRPTAINGEMGLPAERYLKQLPANL
jgi:hypothetical protein